MYMNSEERLTALKRRFYAALLENPVLTRIILEAMDKTGNPQLLPNFMAEPWRNPRVEAFGLVYERGTSAQDGIVNVTFSTFAYIEVLTVVGEPTNATLLNGRDPSGTMFYFDGSAALMELTDISLTERAQAAAHFLAQFQAFNRAAMELGAEIDPMMGTFTTEPRSYQIPE
jgi:hypothetical protein